MIALVDCNNFFASCERLFRPDLKNKPVLVLSNNDGCVVARSEEVKALGVPMAGPYFKIRDIVERSNINCFSSNFPLYSNISQRILGVLSAHAPQIEVYSIDEAFLDISKLAHVDFSEWGDMLASEVKTTIGMPVSVGIAPTKTLAKMASAYAKKQAMACVLDPIGNPKMYEEVLSKTPVGEVWGVGWRSEPQLRQVGIKNALQLSKVSKSWIHSRFGVKGVRTLAELGGTVMYSFEQDVAPQKSLMASRSFGHTVKNAHDLEVAVATFASQAAHKLRRHNQVAHSFGVYLRYRAKGEERTRGQSLVTRLQVPTNDTGLLVSVALDLMAQMYDSENGYKKAGVFAGRLSGTDSVQKYLFDSLTDGQRARRGQLMEALDTINGRYGEETIHIGSIDHNSTKWHALKGRMSPAYVTDWSQIPSVHPIE